MIDARDAVRRLGTILSVWAHPDDETYLAGGVMAAARDQGQRVVWASATAGEHGTDDPETWPPHRLAAIRRWEAAAAMAVLGVTEHRLAGFPDGCLADDDAAGTAWVAGLLDEVEPDTILTFGPDGATFHPDHVAVHRWVTAAWRARGRRERLLYASRTTDRLARYGAFYESWGMYMTEERPVGVPADRLAVHVRLEDDQLDRKITALRTLATQTSALVAHLGPAEYAMHFAEEAFVGASG